MGSMTQNLRILRQLLGEIRKSSSNGKINDSLIVRYIFNQFKRYNISDQQLCKAQDEMKYLCNTYLCYLSSMRRYNEIRSTYKGKGERSIKETADMVGFKLPHDPK